TGFEPVQTPAWHVSVCVQALPSLHTVPFAAFGFEQVPVAGLHVPARWHWSRAVHVTGLEPVQTPAWHVSVCVQALPSLHAVPFDALGFEQVPVPGSHVPARWHWSLAVHVTGLEPVQTPAWHVSVCVQAFPSSHAAVLFECMQTPLWLHESSVHGFPSSQLPLSVPSFRVPSQFWSIESQISSAPGCTLGSLSSQSPPQTVYPSLSASS